MAAHQSEGSSSFYADVMIPWPLRQAYIITVGMHLGPGKGYRRGRQISTRLASRLQQLMVDMHNGFWSSCKHANLGLCSVLAVYRLPRWRWSLPNLAQ